MRGIANERPSSLVQGSQHQILTEKLNTLIENRYDYKYLLVLLCKNKFKSGRPHRDEALECIVSYTD